MKKLVSTWGFLALGTFVACALFAYAMSLPFYYRVASGGDAREYLKMAQSFSSLRDGFFYVGDRTNGFPIFLYLVSTIFSPKSFSGWVNLCSYIQLLFHIGACVYFYVIFLKDNFRKAALPNIAAPLVAFLLIAYPTLVSYTTTPMTDTFCADLLMIAATLHWASRNSNNTITSVQCAMCGLLLGYSIMVRPSFWPPVVAFYCVYLLQAVITRENRRFLIRRIAIMIIATLLPILPVMMQVQATSGVIGLQNNEFVQYGVAKSLQNGLSSVRVYWSRVMPSQEYLPGVRDPYLERNYGKQCQVDSINSLVKCLLSRPSAIPVYFGKKIIALFDAPHLQPYAVDLTPHWFSSLVRPFEVLAFCGFIALMISVVSRTFLKTESVWIGAPWATLVLVLILVHVVLHIEGRYGFPVIPFALASLFLGFAGARQAGRMFMVAWLVIMIVSAVLFTYQVYSWDSVPFT